MTPAIEIVAETPQKINLNPNQIESFWARVNKNGSIPQHRPELGNCWEWTETRNKKGYGRVVFGTHGKDGYQSFQTHRLAYELSGELITLEKPWVLHSCDNTACCRPSHLFAGNGLDNAQDRDLKKRGKWLSGDENASRKHPENMAHGKNNGAHTHPEKVNRGSDVGNSKLTDEKVSKIRAALRSGIKKTQSQLASEFGVDQTTISLIKIGKIWKHVP
jgi:hypothetical protein